jgi:hypothetical protein
VCRVAISIAQLDRSSFPSIPFRFCLNCKSNPFVRHAHLSDASTHYTTPFFLTPNFGLWPGQGAPISTRHLPTRGLTNSLLGSPSCPCLQSFKSFFVPCYRFLLIRRHLHHNGAVRFIFRKHQKNDGGFGALRHKCLDIRRMLF